MKKIRLTQIGKSIEEMKNLSRQERLNSKKHKRTDSNLKIFHEIRDALRTYSRRRDEFIKVENSGKVERSNDVINQYINELNSSIRKMSYKLNNLKRGL